ncbi:hypothetical protein FRC98_09470 [Lujinxingia vulgaris]|uniref:DUF4178 domain-containing protein n=1 Tax=Lujinxingia vulgaris TaxID=2600176 RepID=A0A5C6X585_9DELT|nr:hypothetical protein [Lujinxingia vulgaris]TXD36960.1 hypothetical protein FRC98_09470 [Lujinxingia vulgaris]
MTIRDRPLIPAFFALFCLVGAIYGMMGERKTLIYNETANFAELNTPQKLIGLELDPERMYTLNILYAMPMPVNGAMDVGAAVLNSDGEELLELEDSYWRETGVWREGGESGTWDEQNARTQFNFRVPDAGTYSPQITLFSARAVPAAAFKVQILRSKPRIVGSWPFWLGLLIFIGVAGYVANGRTKVTRKHLEKMGSGSKLKLRGELLTVVDVREHREPGEETGYELRLQNHRGEEHFIAIETYEEEYTDSEGDDCYRNHRYMLHWLELSPDELASVSQQAHNQRWVRVRNTTLSLDRNNSGSGSLTTRFEGETYQSNYKAWVYLPSPFPRIHAGGALILEHLLYEDRGEHEWSLMEILTWKDIEIIELKPRA